MPPQYHAILLSPERHGIGGFTINCGSVPCYETTQNPAVGSSLFPKKLASVVFFVLKITILSLM